MYETRFSASDALYSLANNDYNDNENDSEESPSEPSSAVYTPVPQTKKTRLDKRKKLKRPVTNLDTYLTPPGPTKHTEPDSFKRKQSQAIASNRVSDRTQQPVLIGNDETIDTHTDRSYTDRPKHNNNNNNNNGFTTTINLPSKNVQPSRLQPSKVLIKRVNYNYHPIIDFFFRDRAVKANKSKENRTGHSIVS